MSFSFDSEESKKSVDSDSKVFKAAAAFHASGFFWHAGGSVSHSDAEQDFNSKMSQADISVSAKLLWVTINRNWFRPSLFDSCKLGMVSFCKCRKISFLSKCMNNYDVTVNVIFLSYQIPIY